MSLEQRRKQDEERKAQERFEQSLQRQDHRVSTLTLAEKNLEAKKSAALENIERKVSKLELLTKQEEERKAKERFEQ